MTTLRKLCLLLTALAMLMTACTPAAPAPDPTVGLQDLAQPPQLLLDDKPFTPDPSPIMADEQLYLPFMESLALLSVQTADYPEQDALTAYQDNRYLRVDTEALTITRNGRTLRRKPLVFKDTVYVPASVIFGTFHLNVAYPKDGVISITRQDSQDISQLVDGEYFVPISVKEDDLQFSVPKSWGRLPGAPYRFGEESDYDRYQLTFYKEPIDGLSDSELMTRTADRIAATEGLLLNREQTGPLSVNGLSGLTAAFTFESDSATGRVLLYVFKRNDTAYIFSGRIDTAIYEATVNNQMTAVARSLRFGDMAVDVQREHYIEAPAYFEKGLLVESPLYSNMTVNGRFPLAGTVDAGSADWLNVVINRGDDTLTQKVPIVDHRFSAQIILPFGLGKHDLTLYAGDEEPTPQDRILQVSIVNTSAQEARWIVPSTLVDADSEYISSQSSLLTYKTYGDYLKARKIFAHTIETLAPRSPGKTPSSASQTYLRNTGSEQEMTIFYAALLRAAEIPARIVTGRGADTRTWVEMQINGQWVASDPWAARQRMVGGAPVAEAVDAFFNMSRAYFAERYSKMETLPW